MSVRMKEIKNLLERYYSTEDSFEQTDLAIEIIQGHVDWLIEQAERVQELEDIIYKDERQAVLESMYEENKRYREALRKIIKEGENGEYSHYTAQRVLEEKTDE